MKVLLFGNNGMVGTAVQTIAENNNIDYIAYNRKEADFSNPQLCADIVMHSDADVIINAAAYTAVDKAEDEIELAHIINSETPAAIAAAANIKNISFIHISTDYIFSATGQEPIVTDDPKAPINAYGASKLAGEEAIIASGCHYVILRTSWVFSDHGNNFVKTMLRLAKDRDALSIVSDQIGGPTSAYSIADTCIRIAAALKNGEPGGVYHFSGAPDTDWASFAREIFAQSQINMIVRDITSAEFQTPAKRPSNSRLNCDSTLSDFNIKRPCWKHDLSYILKELDK